MIHVRVELWPAGDQSKAVHLGTATIANDTTGTERIGNYKFKFSRRDNADTAWRSGEVKNFKRLKYGVWDLLAHALINALGADRLKGE